jgi:hypothetical protein
MSGLLAALWLLGLFAAAPALRTSGSYGIADRLRDALILGIAIPFALGFVHLLYPVACWGALGFCLIVAYARNTIRTRADSTGFGAHPPYLLIAALAAVAWPPLMRPLLDGDSLSYHLPNAASWVQAHSLWTTATRYWWYPPASELYASALYAVSGSFALPWCGFGALALLGMRIVAWTREIGGAPLFADALGAATVTAYPLALQSGTLQNDVWLAAFWLEALCALRATQQSAAAMRTVAVAALIKPQGWLLAAVALLARKSPARIWFAAIAATAVWFVRDALLWKSALFSPTGSMFGGVWASSILAHGVPALDLLARVGLATSPFASIAFGAALLGAAIAREDRGLGWAATFAALLFLTLPFGYNTSVAQLATGASLRFALPAITAGAMILARPSLRLALLTTPLLLASALFGVSLVLAIFWNDAPARVAPLVGLLAIGAFALARAVRRPWPIAIGFTTVAVVASLVAAAHPADFFADAYSVGGRPAGLYAWIAKNRLPAIGGWGLALGSVNVLSPQTRTIELPDTDACVTARRLGLALAAVAENDRSATFNQERLRAARACGAILYDDGIAVVAAPADVH